VLGHCQFNDITPAILAAATPLHPIAGATNVCTDMPRMTVPCLLSSQVRLSFKNYFLDEATEGDSADAKALSSLRLLC